MKGVLAHLLGLVHCGVGARDQVVRIVRVFGVDGDPETAGELQRESADHAGLRHELVRAFDCAEGTVGAVDVDELREYWIDREKTVDPSGRYSTGEPVYEGLPYFGHQLIDACHAGDLKAVEEGFVRFSTLYNIWVEGVLTMPSYEIVIDTCDIWGRLGTLRHGFKQIVADEGRHITFGTAAIEMHCDSLSAGRSNRIASFAFFPRLPSTRIVLAPELKAIAPSILSSSSCVPGINAGKC